MPAPILITWTALCDGGACEDGIREHFPALRAAGVIVPEDETTISVDLLALVQVLGVDVALSAAAYAEVDDPRLRLFAADCAERVLLREREGGREPAPWVWATVEVVRRYARGEATAGELAAAMAANEAAASAARAAAWTANEAAAWAAARAAAWTANEAAARAANEAAARAARAAAWTANEAAAWSAMAAAWAANEAAAWAANEAAATEREWQTQRLTYYLTTETA